jgi:tetratricopeptide (TPR) repeat protein
MFSRRNLKSYAGETEGRFNTCYVSMPYGVKGGVDFDQLYHKVVIPAANASGLHCRRADELNDVLFIQMRVVEAIIKADVMIADVSIQNSNVMYELGIRHALRRGVTILLTSDTLPFSLSDCYALHYKIEPNGTILDDSANEVREKLQSILQERIGGRVVNDSPIFEYFPSLRVELPEELQPSIKDRYIYPADVNVRRSGRLDSEADVARAEKVARGTANLDPQFYIDILKRYRDLSAWEDVIRFADSLPPDTKNSPQVVHIVAFAFNRLGQLDSAIALLSDYLQRTGGDADTFGLLGSIYKKRYFSQGAIDDLHAAVDQYRRGYAKGQQDLYLGLNLIMLLLRDDRPIAVSELSVLLLEVRKLADQKLKSSPVPDYLTLEPALILSVLARDWHSARQLIDRIVAMKPDPWLLDATQKELKAMADVLEPFEREQLYTLLGGLVSVRKDEEEEEEEEDA